MRKTMAELTKGEKISLTKQAKRICVDFVCEVCGKKDNLTPGRRKHRRTCSRKCSGVLNSNRLKLFWENPSTEFIQKLRTKAVERRKFGRADKETKPEKTFREELEKRKIVYDPQFRFGGLMVVDFFIPSLQAFVFIDGSYWHSLESSLEKDGQQVLYARSKGIKVYRFTDKEVFRNVKKCVDFVLEDAEQPFSFAEVIDKLTILAIKAQLVKGERAKQILKDYRRMETVVLAGLEHYYIANPRKVLEVLKELSVTNIKIFMLVDKVQKNEHTKAEAKKLQDLNSYRSQLKNAINAFFDERQEDKI